MLKINNLRTYAKSRLLPQFTINSNSLCNNYLHFVFDTDYYCIFLCLSSFLCYYSFLLYILLYPSIFIYSSGGYYHTEETKTHCSVQYNVLLWYYPVCRIYCLYWRIYCRLYIPLPYFQVIAPNK